MDCAEKLSDKANNPESVSDESPAQETTMVPPLQQKIELLKKVANVESFYDDPENTKPSDELKRMQMNAGITPTVIGDDEVTE
jgi:hypothetical protein